MLLNGEVDECENPLSVFCWIVEKSSALRLRLGSGASSGSAVPEIKSDRRLFLASKSSECLHADSSCDIREKS